MIVGMILDVTNSLSTANNNKGTGAMLQFYTWKDAIVWARETSINAVSDNENLISTTMILNITTGERRWWFNGVEQTG